MSGRKEVRILVVDDQVEQFDSLNEYAEMYHADYQVVCQRADSPISAREMMRTWNPSVVLLDVHVTEEGGGDQISYFSDAGAPVVVMSRVRSQNIEESAMSKGAMAYVSKSDNPDDVEALLELLGAVATTVGSPRH